MLIEIIWENVGIRFKSNFVSRVPYLFTTKSQRSNRDDLWKNSKVEASCENRSTSTQTSFLGSVFYLLNENLKSSKEKHAHSRVACNKLEIVLFHPGSYVRARVCFILRSWLFWHIGSTLDPSYSPRLGFWEKCFTAKECLKDLIKLFWVGDPSCKLRWGTNNVECSTCTFSSPDPKVANMRCTGQNR